MWHIDCHFLTLVLECKQFLFILPATAIYYHTYITFTNILVSLLLLRGCGGDTLTKSSLKEKGFSLAHSSGSLFIIAGKSKQQGHLNSWSGHTRSQEREKACTFSLGSLFTFIQSRAQPQEWSDPQWACSSHIS